MARRKPRNDEDIIKHKPTDYDWTTITTLYFQGKSPQQILDAMPTLDICKKTIERYISRKKLEPKKRAMEERVIDACVMKVEDAKQKVNEDCIMLFQKGANVINELLDNCSSELSSGEYTKGQARATAYNVDMLMSGVTKIQKGLRVAYGMDANGNLYEKEPEVLTIEGLDTTKI